MTSIHLLCCSLILLLSLSSTYQGETGNYSHNCSENCLDCSTLSSGKKNCFKCSQGYRLISATTCVPCVLNGCLSCPHSTSECRGCKMGYFNSTLSNSLEDLELVNRCSKCMDGCYSCKKIEKCEICKPGFQINEFFECESQSLYIFPLLVVVFSLAVICLVCLLVRYDPMNLKILKKLKRKLENLNFMKTNDDKQQENKNIQDWSVSQGTRYNDEEDSFEQAQKEQKGTGVMMTEK